MMLVTDIVAKGPVLVLYYSLFYKFGDVDIRGSFKNATIKLVSDDGGIPRFFLPQFTDNRNGHN